MICSINIQHLFKNMYSSVAYIIFQSLLFSFRLTYNTIQSHNNTYDKKKKGMLTVGILNPTESNEIKESIKIIDQMEIIRWR